MSDLPPDRGRPTGPDPGPRSGPDPDPNAPYRVYRASAAGDSSAGGAGGAVRRPAPVRSPYSRTPRSRASRRRRLLVRRLVALAVLVVLIAVVAGVAWATLGGGDEGAAGGGNGGDAAAAGGSGSGVASGGGAADPSGSPSPSAEPAEAAAPAVIEIGWVGDVTPGSKYGLPPDGGRALFAPTKKALSRPDLMIANLEGTYSSPGPSKCDGADSGLCFAFQAPPSYVKALTWSGIDMVSVANNHSYDYLQGGFDETIETLDGAGVEYTGRPDQVTVVDVDGVRVATIGFSPYSWNPSIIDIPAAEKLVEKAAAKADVVVVLMHAGAEGSDKIHTPTGTEVAFGENRGDSQAFAHACIDAGADLVLGSGPHVIRGIERYNDRLIAYSLGNFGGWGNFGTGGNLSLSGLLTVKVDAKGRVYGGRWLSLYISSQGVPSVDSGDTAARLVEDLSAADFPKTYDLDANGYFTTALGRADD